MVIKDHNDCKPPLINLDGLCVAIGSGGEECIWWCSEIPRKGMMKGIIIWSSSCENSTTKLVGPKYSQH
jgi:hypothetical protein